MNKGAPGDLAVPVASPLHPARESVRMWGIASVLSRPMPPTRCLATVARETGYPVQAVEMILEAGEEWDEVADYTLLDVTGATSGAVNICRRLCENAKSLHGSRGIDLLEQFDLVGSEDVGRVALGLVAAGWLSLPSVGTSADFDGLFLIRHLFATL